MSRIRQCFRFLAVVFLCISHGALASETGRYNDQAALIAESSYIRAGEVFRVGVKISTAKKNHIYWKNPGEIGSPLSLKWDLPEGFVVEKEYWPAPNVFQEEGLTYFGYDNTTLIIADIRAPVGAVNEEIFIKAQVEWLACSSGGCNPGYENLSLRLICRDGESSSHPIRVEEFKKVAASSPKPFPNDGSVVLEKYNNSAKILAHHRADKVWFIPEQGQGFIVFDSKKPEGDYNTWMMKGDLADLHGVLVFTNRQGEAVASYEINLSQPESVVKGFSNYAILLIMSFLGGLLLNIMPCVLPLITLKVYGLIKSAGKQHIAVIVNALYFTLGVVGCFWGLAGIAFFLKILGHNIGWGFHLQEPLFVAILMIIFFLFALSSLGLFEVGALASYLGGRLRSSEEYRRSENTAIGSIFNGVLATLVTTPCTGPFLGSTLGLVMSLSFVKQIMIFTSIGLGMASPYLVFAIFPRMLALLPKPGEWMNTFKELTGFMLLATVTWLAWIFSAETSGTALVILLAGLWLAGVGAWVLGKWGVPVASKRARVLSTTIFITLVCSAVGLGVVASRCAVEENVVIEQGKWEKFSVSKLEQLHRDGHPVFVNFTAKWCLTCQVNKPILHAQAAQKRFEERGIVTLEADWTRKDPEITGALAKVGRASVPTYVYYPVNGDPIVLPEQLTQSILEKMVFSQP